jgi:RNA polymerase sigma factor (sigma-70 family)
MTADEIISGISQGGRLRELSVESLVNDFYRPFLGFFIYKGLSSHEAEDLFQEVVIKIIKGAINFSPEMKGEAWLWQVARNALIDHRRSYARNEKLNTPVNSSEDWELIRDQAADRDSAVNEGELGLDDVSRCVDGAMAEFEKDEPDRAYALILQMEDKSIDQIANVIGRSVGATKEYLSQCRKKLAPFIQHCLELLPA